MTNICHKKSSATHSRSALSARLCGVFICMLALLCGASCTRGEHSGYASVSPHGWIYGDTLIPIKGIQDSTLIVRGDMAVALRHSNSYDYSNIWLSLIYSTPDSTVTDTINITLADDFGNWLGQGMGLSYQLVDTIRRDIAIDICKPVKITHIMRTDTLSGIEQAGVVVIDKTTNQ